MEDWERYLEYDAMDRYQGGEGFFDEGYDDFNPIYEDHLDCSSPPHIHPQHQYSHLDVNGNIINNYYNYGISQKKTVRKPNSTQDSSQVTSSSLVTVPDYVRLKREESAHKRQVLKNIELEQIRLKYEKESQKARSIYLLFAILILFSFIGFLIFVAKH